MTRERATILRRLPSTGLLLVLLPLVAGCVTAGDDVPTGALAPEATPSAPARASLSAPGPAAAFAAQEYRLSPQDVIEVSVFQVPDLNRTAQVNAAGLISLPLIGTVQAGGRTVRELEADIARRYGARYLQSPQVNVFVKEYTSQRVTVDGAVNAPGVYQLSGAATLLQAVAMARGLDRTGDETAVMIFRMIDGQRQGAVFDLRQIRSGQVPDPAIVGGDTVVVDQSAALAAWRALRESAGLLTVFRPVWW